MASDLEQTLESVASGLAAAAGDNLRTLLVRGSAARGDYHAKRSDVNLVIILDDTSAGALKPLGGVVAKWVRSGQPPPVIFSAQDWRDSTDVFPIELEDMRSAHRLLRGEDPFAEVATEAPHVRHELEREARGKLIQLRAEYVAVASNGKWLGALLLSSAKTFFVLFRALVRVGGATVPEREHDLVRAAAEIAGFEPDAFTWPLARLGGARAADLVPYDPSGARYLAAIEQFVQYVDRM